MTMGTASTMACVTEALGLTLPGGAAIPAVDSRRHHLAEAAGRQIVELVERDLTPSDILTREAFENAIRVLHAISGSTNAILHLIAYAGPRRRRAAAPAASTSCARSTPWLVDLKPAGRFLMEDFFYAGGVPAVMAQIADLLAPRRDHRHRADGRREHRRRGDREPRRDPARAPTRSTRAARSSCSRGNLCPDGAVMKITAADPALLAARGPRARVRGHPRPRRPRRRPRARVRRLERDGAPQRGAGRRRPACRSGATCRSRRSSCEQGVTRPAADLRRAHERHVVRRGRAARRARVGGRRPARARPATAT